jgi:hypothetical protein
MKDECDSGSGGVIPLEAIISLYAILRRRVLPASTEAGRPPREDSVSSADSNRNAPSSSTAGPAESRPTHELEQLAKKSSDRQACNAADAAPAAMAGMVPLRFLAYAARHHAALGPIDHVLRAAFGKDSGVSTFPSSPSLPGPPSSLLPLQRQRTAWVSAPLPKTVVEDLTRLLSVSTVLHVGLGDVLCEPTTRSLASSTLSPSVQQQKHQQQQHWTAVRIIHHLERYGAARDYLEALTERWRGEAREPVGRGSAAEATTQKTVPGLTCSSDNQGSESSAAKEMADGGKKCRTASESTHQQYRQPSLSTHLNVIPDPRLDEEAEGTLAARAVLEAAACLQPSFTRLLHTLREAWELQNARRAATTSASTEPRTMRDNTNNSNADDNNVAAIGTLPTCNNAATRGKNENTTVRVSSAWSLPSPDAAASTDGAALAVVRSFAQGDAACSSPAYRRDVADGTALEGAAAMSTAELTRLTLDVAHFAWGAMSVLRRSASCEGSPATNAGRGDGTGQGMGDVAASSQESDGAALHQLLRTATRFSTYADLHAWLECVLLSPAQGNPRDGVTVQQHAALLCLLKRAVRRAPSWAAVCTLIQLVWPRLAPAEQTAEKDAIHISFFKHDTDEGALRWGRGVASCQELLDAFFDSPHAPARRPNARDELAFWCSVICTPCFRERREAAWYEGSPQGRLLDPVEGVPPTASAAAAKKPLSKAKWSALWYGSSPSTARVCLRERVLWHNSVTASATRLARQWLLPFAEHAATRDCLAVCHAQCAEVWSAAVSVAPPSISLSAADDAHCGGSMEVEDMQVTRRVAVRHLALQHRAFCSVFLTDEEAFDWLALVLCRTPAGMARQLVLLAAVSARWGSGSHGGSTDAAKQSVQQVHPQTPAEASTFPWNSIYGRAGDKLSITALSLSLSPPPLTATQAEALVADLTTVFQRWIAAGADESTRANLGAVGLERHGNDVHSLVAAAWVACECGGRLGEVGALFDDVAATVTLLDPTVHAASYPVLSDGVASLRAIVRRGITAVGLQWEREVVSSSHLPAQLAAFPEHIKALSVSSSCHENEVRLARLHEWLHFLCTSPTLLLADEAHVVVWLYVLMKLVEELHPQSGVGNSAATDGALIDSPGDALNSGATAPLHKSEGGDEDVPRLRGPAWTVQAEEDAVRRVAHALSGKLWSTLPRSSLLPPMLLNWLLTRGGMHTWGEAVRFLRSAAASVRPRAGPSRNDGGSGDDEHELHDTAAAEGGDEGQRRYLLLALPLDRVTSMTHAMRVLRTLQAVYENCCHDAEASSDEEGERQRRRCNAETDDDEASLTHWKEVWHERELAGWTAFKRRSRVDWGSSGGVVIPSLQSPRSTSTDDPVTVLVHNCYREIERVLLREWYGRAVAAVLDFLLEHPEHTHLTFVTDAPDHAAVVLRARLALEEDACCGRGDVAVGCPDQQQTLTTASQQHSEVLLQDMGETDALGKGNGRTVGRVDELGGCALREETDDDPEGRDSRQRVAEPSTLHKRHVTATTPMRVPLHFLGAFVLQEGRLAALMDEVGGDEATQLAAKQPSTGVAFHEVDAGAVPTGAPYKRRARAKQTRANLPSPTGGRLLAPSSLMALLDGAEGLISTNAGAPNAPPASSCYAPRCTLGGYRGCPVHPELLALYKRVLELKKAELADSDGAEPPLHEMVEEFVGEILARHTVAP